MKTRSNTYINRALIALYVLFVFAAMPAQAGDLPPGAKCVNGLVMVPRTGAPGKEFNWIPMQKKCEAADFAAMEHQAGAREDDKVQGESGLVGKPGYIWQHPGTK